MDPKVEREIVAKILSESLRDAGVIASSAITLAVERSHDLSMNPVVALVVLRMLCEKNIVKLNEEMAKTSGIPLEIHKFATEEITEIAEKFLSNKVREVTIG